MVAAPPTRAHSPQREQVSEVCVTLLGGDTSQGVITEGMGRVGGRHMLLAQSQSPSPSGLSSRGGSWNWMFTSMSRMAAMSLFTPWLRSCPAPASSSPSCLMSSCKTAVLGWAGSCLHRREGQRRSPKSSSLLCNLTLPRCTRQEPLPLREKQCTDSSVCSNLPAAADSTYLHVKIWQQRSEEER